MKAFYDSIRASLFGGSLKPSVVTSIETILAKCREYGVTQPEQIAYILATVLHEVGPNLQPVWENLNYSAQALAGNWPHRYAVDPKARLKVPNALALKLHRNPEAIANNCYADRMGNGNEKSGDGWKFRGGGWPQVTGKDNFMRVGKAVGVDLLKFPERINEVPIAAVALVVGMRDGWYTGRKLSHFFKPGFEELPAKDRTKMWLGARSIINGTDKAALIQTHAEKFLTGLMLANPMKLTA